MPRARPNGFKPAPAASSYGGTAVWSGDRVLRDAEGLLYFAGRRDAMIKSAGNRISPSGNRGERRWPPAWVAEAIALGVPDERLGQAVHLIVAGPRPVWPMQGPAAQIAGEGIAQFHAAARDSLA